MVWFRRLSQRPLSEIERYRIQEHFGWMNNKPQKTDCVVVQSKQPELADASQLPEQLIRPIQFKKAGEQLKK